MRDNSRGAQTSEDKGHRKMQVKTQETKKVLKLGFSACPEHIQHLNRVPQPLGLILFSVVNHLNLHHGPELELWVLWLYTYSDYRICDIWMWQNWCLWEWHQFPPLPQHQSHLTEWRTEGYLWPEPNSYCCWCWTIMCIIHKENKKMQLSLA